MSQNELLSDAINWHMSELTSRIVAKSGIPSDRFHLGKIILQSMKDNPDMILQIDGATGQEVTNAQCLERSIRCAVALTKMGVKKDDVIVLMAPNHLDLVIPVYAALFIGVGLAPVDRELKVAELRDTFQVIQPKIIFCQSKKTADVETVLKLINADAKIISFDESDTTLCFREFINVSNGDEVQSFKPADFNPEKTVAILIPTSGSTGPPKSAGNTHKNLAISEPCFWNQFSQFPPIKSSLLFAPLQWVSGLLIMLCAPYMRFTRIQSSLPITRDHAYYLINKYKPETVILSPTLMATLIDPGTRDQCDFTCFKNIFLGGSAVHEELVEELKLSRIQFGILNEPKPTKPPGMPTVNKDTKNTFIFIKDGETFYVASIKKISPKTEAMCGYGMSEAPTTVFHHKFSAPAWACGKPSGCFNVKIVDLESGKEIKEPNVQGELWIKGPGVFQGYYNKPEATEAAFDNGWFKTGDLFYRDDSWNFFFVDRLKLLLKYKNHQISPVEIEAVILKHPGVLDVAVTGLQDRESGELPVACVVPKLGHEVTADEIKELVQESLTETKHLRGGVVFLDQLPMTASTKIHRRKLRELVLNMKRL